MKTGLVSGMVLLGILTAMAQAGSMVRVQTFAGVHA